ncbi:MULTISPECIES: protein phosphatase CheZ [unclassified Pseudoxanthomonas]|jgi:chemotaxis protein CheZ|uniref:protein phosphatase CheZ n=1 Tax=unclassified Pseudoxanthomonas TaxID=2645906 RepID=UPI0008E4F4B0|nr:MULTISPECIES: protein phosphatase CheZ [unclassified Pseudoxanthomonas]PPJ40857.1 chemotaxis protein [Pseudoxanthomonas sp. KAs_5_3]SFV26100.1 chemotaxis protein CheZ [Pseudoxanthomonas sp. YR558]
MNAVADVTGARAALVERLQHALDALEQGDEAGWRRELDTIAAWRTQPMMQGLGRLARELAQTLGELPPTDAGELDDACSRLDHVVEMTEQASHKTLDLAEQCRGYATQLKGTALSAEQAALVDSIGKGLSEMALAQSYQDLTGQIIRRVAGIVRRVHEGFGALGLPPPEKKETSELAGPAVAGLDRNAFSQDDADDLLSGLGL